MSQFTSGFWDLYIALITIVSIVACARAAEDAERAQGLRAAETSGHVWDEDLTRIQQPAAALVDVAVLPAPSSSASSTWCCIRASAATRGTLGWTQVKQLRRENAQAQTAYGPIYDKFAAQDVETLSKNPEALAIGQKLFLNNCAQCHASDGGGSRGFPNLTDEDWLWGGTPEAIKTTHHRRPHRRHAAAGAGARRGGREGRRALRARRSPAMRTIRSARRAARRSSRRSASPATAPRARATRRWARRT